MNLQALLPLRMNAQPVGMLDFKEVSQLREENLISVKCMLDKYFNLDHSELKRE